ncbi:MAG TPA: SAM-dependent methyltransferase [Actinospica sp.]|nr:SAM-dependent methyltransferase [Actinospica sp.]
MDAVGRAELALTLAGIDPEKPSPARIYDFWLGGSQNFEADRAAGRRAAEAMPTLTAAIRANRAFLGRAVRHLATDYGVTQFLDLGSGVPTVGNVHEVAKEANPEVRVVYVDIDPVAIAHARHLLAEVDGVEAILADLRRPETVLGHPLVPATLDLDKPVALLFNAVLHFIADAEEPDRIVREYLRAVAPGSFLALSHAAPDLTHRDEQETMLEDYRRSTAAPFINREPEVIAGWLEGMEICPPGLVTVDKWMPEPDAPTERILRTYGVLARKTRP